MLIENHGTLNVLALLFFVVAVVCCFIFVLMGKTPYRHGG
jgi:hypothetical protein